MVPRKREKKLNYELKLQDYVQKIKYLVFVLRYDVKCETTIPM